MIDLEKEIKDILLSEYAVSKKIEFLCQRYRDEGYHLAKHHAAEICRSYIEWRKGCYDAVPAAEAGRRIAEEIETMEESLHPVKGRE